MSWWITSVDGCYGSWSVAKTLLCGPIDTCTYHIPQFLSVPVSLWTVWALYRTWSHIRSTHFQGTKYGISCSIGNDDLNVLLFLYFYLNLLPLPVLLGLVMCPPILPFPLVQDHALNGDETFIDVWSLYLFSVERKIGDEVLFLTLFHCWFCFQVVWMCQLTGHSQFVTGDLVTMKWRACKTHWAQ